MIFILKYIGLVPAYIVLRFVSFYFIPFAPTATKSLYYYFHHRLKFSRWKTILYIFKNYFVFAQTLLDKTAMMAGLLNKFKLDRDTGNDIIDFADNNKKGLVIISAHVGNWAVSSHLLNNAVHKVNVIMYDVEHEAIKNYLNSVNTQKEANFIFVKEDGSHVFEISNALMNNEIICVLGDRFLDGNKSIECNFFGENAIFPAGMYHMAAKLDVPVVHVFTMKKSYFHYRLYASKVKTYTYPKTAAEREACIRTMAEDYVHSLENILQKYPAQWFNYYPFWKKASR